MRYIIQKLSLVVLLLSGYSYAAPEILSYSGKMSVSGQPYNGTAELKIALVNRSGTFSYWTNDGNFTTPQEPVRAISVNVSNGDLYRPLGRHIHHQYAGITRFGI